MDRRAFFRGCARAVAYGAAGGAIGDGAWRVAQGQVPRGAEPAAVERWTRTVCDLCGLNEPVFLASSRGRLTAVKGIPHSTIGFGRLCPRASALWAASVEHRALRPMVRRDPTTKGSLEGLEPASWDEALAVAAEGIGRVRERVGPGGVAFLSSDGETSETYHVLSKAARSAFGTDHVDTPARLEAFAAYDACRDLFGVPGNVGSLEDIDAADLLLLVGGDLAESHPGLFYRVLDARRNGRARVVLIDARKTLAAGIADLHLRPRPGWELSVVNALCARLAPDRIPAATAGDVLPDGVQTTRDWRAWLAGDLEADAPGCRAALDPVAGGTRRALRAVAEMEESGLSADELDRVVEMWLGPRRDPRAVTTIVGPSALAGPAGRPLARAVVQLHRATGSWGAPGKGALFLPKGANASGVVTHGVSPGRLPGDRSLQDPAHREQVAGIWQVPLDGLPEVPGLSLLEWPAAVSSGRLGALVIVRANPAAELPAASLWRDALTAAFVVSGTTHSPTETDVYADVVLPLALVAGESAGTTTALDRRYQLLERVVDPPGEARSATEMILALTRSQLDEAAYRRSFAAYESGPHVALEEWRRLSSGTAVDGSGITMARLRSCLGLKWPCLTDEDPGLERVGPPGGTPAPAPAVRTHPTFIPTPLPDCLPIPTSARPFLLVGGPIREHLRSRLRTGLASDLHYEAPVARIEMHPLDGSRLGVGDGEWLTLESDSGQLTARVWLVERSPQGVLFLPEHFGFISDVQGGTGTLKEPEGLFHLLTGDRIVGQEDAAAGWIVPVSARKPKRRDMRKRGLRT